MAEMQVTTPGAEARIMPQGPRAKGAFGPGPDAALHPRVVEALSGDQFMRLAPQLFIGGCGDERLDVHGSRLLLPPVFAGFFAAVLSDAITARVWYRPGMSAQQHALLMLGEVRQLLPNVQLCIHTDTHAGEECGCAAIAKARAVLELLLDYADLIDVQYREDILLNIKQLLADGYFGPGTTALVDRLEAAGATKETLDGPHNGLLVVRNRRHGYIYDRPAFYRWCQQQGLPLTPFFEYTEWSMRETAKLLMEHAGDDSRYFFAGGDAFNTAVLYAICNPNMPLMVRE